MKNKILYKHILILTLLISLMAPAPVFAARAGITPDSSLYFFDSLFEKISLFFTFNPTKRINKTMVYAEERLAELEVVATKNKTEFVNQAAVKYQQNIGLVSQEIKQIKDEELAEKIFNTISENTTKHQKKLNEILSKVPEEMRPAVQDLIEISLQEHEKAMWSIAELKQEVQKLQRENEELKQQVNQTEIEQGTTQVTTKKQIVMPPTAASAITTFNTQPTPVANNQPPVVKPSQSSINESSSTEGEQEKRLLQCRTRYQQATEDLAHKGLANSSFRNAAREEYELCVASITGDRPKTPSISSPQSAVPAEPATQAKPAASATPATSVIPVQPTTTTTEPITPAIPAQPAQPATPAAPAIPSPRADKTAPVISNIQVSNITQNSVDISWLTNENSDSVVYYGTATSSYNFTAQGTTAIVSATSTYYAHNVSLTNLTSGTIYHYKVSSTDASGNKAESGDKIFTTLPSLDTIAPVISNIQVSNITTDSVTITWTTNKLSNSKVEYGPTQNYADSVFNDAYVLNHSIILSNLISNTTYHFRVSSTDSYDNTAFSEDKIFTTKVTGWDNIKIIGPYTDYRPDYTPGEAWNGSEYGTVWHYPRDGAGAEVYFAKKDQSGNKLTSDIKITNSAGFDSLYPKIAWNGSEFGIVWQDDRESDHQYRERGFKLYFTRVSNNGIKLTNDIKIVDSVTHSGGQQIVWTGSKYGVAYYNGDAGVNEIYLTFINGNGAVEKTTRVSYHISAHSELPSMVWTGSEFGIAWHDAGVYFARFNNSGERIGKEVKIADTGAYTTVSFDGSLYTVTWHSGDGNIYSASGK